VIADNFADDFRVARYFSGGQLPFYVMKPGLVRTVVPQESVGAPRPLGSHAPAATNAAGENASSQRNN
jgi:hypothetical protein